jgi:hypothetical protein
MDYNSYITFQTRRDLGHSAGLMHARVPGRQGLYMRVIPDINRRPMVIWIQPGISTYGDRPVVRRHWTRTGMCAK